MMTAEDKVTCAEILQGLQRELPALVTMEMGWDWLVYPDHVGRDTEEWENKETGEIYPPSFRYIGTLRGRRASDGTYFFQRVELLKDFASLSTEHKLQEIEIAARVAALAFNDFLKCSCVLGSPCERHAA